MAATAAAATMSVGMLAAPAGAQTEAVFTVVKVVDGEGTPPPGTEFVVTVACEGEDGQTTEITFDANGEPLTEPTDDYGFNGVCTFTETQTGGASSVEYACEVNDPEEALCSGGGADPVTIDYGGTDLVATVTVTNTFDPPPPPEPVVVEPVFTG